MGSEMCIRDRYVAVSCSCLQPHKSESVVDGTRMLVLQCDEDGASTLHPAVVLRVPRQHTSRQAAVVQQQQPDSIHDPWCLRPWRLCRRNLNGSMMMIMMMKRRMMILVASSPFTLISRYSRSSTSPKCCKTITVQRFHHTTTHITTAQTTASLATASHDLYCRNRMGRVE